MNKLLKIVTILIVFLTIQIHMNMNYCYAEEILRSPGMYKVDEKDIKDKDKKEIFDRGNVIATVIRNAGIVVAILAMMVLGLRAMFGSVENKTKYKESLPGYLLGVVLVISISLLPSLIYSIAIKS